MTDDLSDLFRGITSDLNAQMFGGTSSATEPAQTDRGLALDKLLEVARDLRVRQQEYLKSVPGWMVKCDLYLSAVTAIAIAHTMGIGLPELEALLVSLDSIVHYREVVPYGLICSAKIRTPGERLSLLTGPESLSKPALSDDVQIVKLEWVGVIL